MSSAKASASNASSRTGRGDLEQAALDRSADPRRESVLRVPDRDAERPAQRGRDREQRQRRQRGRDPLGRGSSGEQFDQHALGRQQAERRHEPGADRRGRDDHGTGTVGPPADDHRRADQPGQFGHDRPPPGAGPRLHPRLPPHGAQLGQGRLRGVRLSVTVVAVMGAPHLGAGRARPTTKRYHDGPTERHGVAS
jgi:hypothetical protein